MMDPLAVRIRLLSLLNKHKLNANGEPFPYTTFRSYEPSQLMTMIHAEAQGEGHGTGRRRVIFPTYRERCEMYTSFVKHHVSVMEDIDLLDEAFFGRLIEFKLKCVLPEDTIIENALDLLSRLPDVPLELHHRQLDPAYNQIPGRYFCNSTEKSWSTLSVSNYLSSAVLALALAQCSGENEVVFMPAGSLCNTVAYLLEQLTVLQHESDNIDCQYFILQSFYWNIWQRAAMLRSHACLKLTIYKGSDQQQLLDHIEIRHKHIYDLYQQALVSNRSLAPAPIEYMCNWALRLFQNSLHSITLDFRLLFERFGDTFGKEVARCVLSNSAQPQRCSGVSPLTCGRFVGMKISDQSAHSYTCSGQCKRLFWNEGSYRKCRDGRAVAIQQDDDGLLQYCATSEATIAISHVWSHGQGGRPELHGTGLNECLHNRYVTIAKRFNCNSYWMDTPCIPEDKALRKEAISNINSIFETSKITLACDRDIASINITQRSPADLERLLAVFLLCDWNVRGWTLLEGMRGRKNLHLLCKNDEVISINEVLDVVWAKGRVDLSILSLVNHQNIAAFKHLDISKVKKPGYQPDWLDTTLEVRGIIPPFEAASLLSHRHATRDGDNIVIWSLLCTRSVYYDAENLWKKGILFKHRLLHSGFLISSLPRLEGVKGLSWAPSRPDLPPISPGDAQTRQFPAFSGLHSAVVEFTGEVLLGVWLHRILKSPISLNHMGSKIRQMTEKISNPRNDLSGTVQRVHDIKNQFLKGYRWGALLRPLVNSGHVNRWKRGEYIRTDPFHYEGSSHGTLLAIVGSNDNTRDSDCVKWIWIDVYEWTDGPALPDFEPGEIALI